MLILLIFAAYSPPSMVDQQSLHGIRADGVDRRCFLEQIMRFSLCSSSSPIHVFVFSDSSWSSSLLRFIFSLIQLGLIRDCIVVLNFLSIIDKFLIYLTYRLSSSSLCFRISDYIHTSILTDLSSVLDEYSSSWCCCDLRFVLCDHNLC